MLYFKKKMGVRIHKPFPRVWLAWGKYWAVQAYLYPCVSFGIHIDPRQPRLDIHFLVFTIAFGPDAHITRDEQKHAKSCRGFLFSDNPTAYL